MTRILIAKIIIAFILNIKFKIFNNFLIDSPEGFHYGYEVLVFFNLTWHYLIVHIPIVSIYDLCLLNIWKVIEELKLGLICWDLNILNEWMDVGIHNGNDFFGFGKSWAVVVELEKSFVNKNLSSGTDWRLFNLPINSIKISCNWRSRFLL